MPSRMLQLLSTTVIFVLPLSAAAQAPQTLDFKSSGKAAGRLHFTPAVLSKYSLDGQDIAKSAASILDFHSAAWGFNGEVFWDIHIYDTQPHFDKLGETERSLTRKVAGGTKPGACVSRMSLQEIANAISGVNLMNGAPLSDPMSWRFEFALAHEAAHCYQFVTSKLHNESASLPPTLWFLEGSANWLAGDYLESTGREYPSYFEKGFRESHQESLLERANSNHFFFKWLEGNQGLKNRAAVIAFVEDMLDVPWPQGRWPGCVVHPPHAACSTPLYEDLVKRWFAKHNTTIASVLSLFGSAIVRGTVPGIRAPKLFLEERRTLYIQPGFNTARMSILATGVPAAVPLGKLTALYKPDDKKGIIPKEFGFYVVEVRLSEPLLPTPNGYLFAMEGVDDNISGRLSSEKSDDVIDQSGWIRTKFLEGNWLSVARSSIKTGQDTRILLKALP